jgi:hypothetical protein
MKMKRDVSMTKTTRVERNNTRMKVTVYLISYTVGLPSLIKCRNENLSYDDTDLPDGVLDGLREGSLDGTCEGWSIFELRYKRYWS